MLTIELNLDHVLKFSLSLGVQGSLETQSHITDFLKWFASQDFNVTCFNTKESPNTMYANDGSLAHIVCMHQGSVKMLTSHGWV